MSGRTSPRLGKRPVFIADYGQAARPQEDQLLADEPVIIRHESKKAGIRYNFPVAGEETEGGFTADGYCYRITFAAGRLERSYGLVRAFLAEQGYADVPLPKDAEELKLFRLPPKLRHQLSLFGDNGYVHNPIKILFPVPVRRTGALVLELYNEAVVNHLLKFHRVE